MESRLLLGFEERVCGEVVGDNVGESWASLLHPGGVCYGTEGCEDTAEQEKGSHHSEQLFYLSLNSSTSSCSVSTESDAVGLFVFLKYQE